MLVNKEWLTWSQREQSLWHCIARTHTDENLYKVSNLLVWNVNLFQYNFVFNFASFSRTSAAVNQHMEMIHYFCICDSSWFLLKARMIKVPGTRPKVCMLHRYLPEHNYWMCSFLVNQTIKHFNVVFYFDEQSVHFNFINYDIDLHLRLHEWYLYHMFRENENEIHCIYEKIVLMT